MTDQEDLNKILANMVPIPLTVKNSTRFAEELDEWFKAGHSFDILEQGTSQRFLQWDTKSEMYLYDKIKNFKSNIRITFLNATQDVNERETRKDSIMLHNYPMLCILEDCLLISQAKKGKVLDRKNTIYLRCHLTNE